MLPNAVIAHGLKNNQIANTFQLSQREYQCIFYVMHGKSVREMAHLMSLSPRTVEQYFMQLKQRFFCKNKSELIEKIIESGLVTLSWAVENK